MPQRTPTTPRVWTSAFILVTTATAFGQEFEAAPGARVTARSSETPVKVGSKVTATLNAGSVFRVEAVQGGWLWVDSGNIRGWVKKADVVPAGEAVAYFTRELSRDPADAQALVSRGIAWHAGKAYDRAIADYTAAVAANPHDPWAFHDRAVTYHALGDYDQALADADHAVTLDPEAPSHLANRAAVRFARKEYDDAIDDYTEALRQLKGDEASLDDAGSEGGPGPTRGRLWAAKWTCARAECWAAKHEDAKAVVDYATAVRLDPKDAATLNSLAWLLATSADVRVRDGLRAYKYAALACTLTGFRDHLCLDTLAAAYAEAGDFPAAVRWESKAVGLAADDDHFADPYRARLRLYEAKTAYHEGEKGAG